MKILCQIAKSASEAVNPSTNLPSSKSSANYPCQDRYHLNQDKPHPKRESALFVFSVRTLSEVECEIHLILNCNWLWTSLFSHGTFIGHLAEKPLQS